MTRNSSAFQAGTCQNRRRFVGLSGCPRNRLRRHTLFPSRTIGTHRCHYTCRPCRRLRRLGSRTGREGLDCLARSCTYLGFLRARRTCRLSYTECYNTRPVGRIHSRTGSLLYKPNPWASSRRCCCCRYSGTRIGHQPCSSRGRHCEQRCRLRVHNLARSQRCMSPNRHKSVGLSRFRLCRSARRTPFR